MDVNVDPILLTLRGVFKGTLHYTPHVKGIIMIWYNSGSIQFVIFV